MNTWCTSNIRSGYFNPYFSPEQYLKVSLEENKKINEINVYERLISKNLDDLKFLFCLEKLGRLIYALEFIKINSDKSQPEKKVIIIGPIKRLVITAVNLRQSIEKNSLITKFAEIGGKVSSPFVKLTLEEFCALEKISRNKSFGDQSFIDLLLRIQARFKSEFKGQIDVLDGMYEEQVKSYLSYIHSLSRYYPNFRWVKVNLNLNFQEVLCSEERLLLISSLSRGFAQKLQKTPIIPKRLVGYICSLNVLSELNPWAEMILFIESDDELSSFQIETSILEFWLLYTNAFKPTAIVFSGSHNFEEDDDNSHKNQFAMSRKLLKLVVYLATRHQFLTPQLGPSSRLKLVTRGVRLRRVRSESWKS